MIDQPNYLQIFKIILMKKIMFAAIALVAFTTVSRANTDINITEDATATNCTEYAYHAVNDEQLAIGKLYSDADYWKAYNWYLSVCQEANSTGTPILQPVIIVKNP